MRELWTEPRAVSLICWLPSTFLCFREVFIDYSLNNGVNFVDEDLKFAGKDCGNNRVGLQEPQWKGGKMEEHKTWEEKVSGAKFLGKHQANSL